MQDHFTVFVVIFKGARILTAHVCSICTCIYTNFITFYLNCIYIQICIGPVGGVSCFRHDLDILLGKNIALVYRCKPTQEISNAIFCFFTGNDTSVFYRNLKCNILFYGIVVFSSGAAEHEIYNSIFRGLDFSTKTAAGVSVFPIYCNASPRTAVCQRFQFR